MSLSLFRPKVKLLVRDGAAVLADPADYDFSLQEAVKRYSRTKPRVVVEDIAGSGAFDYALPASWSDEMSRVRSVEYPAGDREPHLVDALDWQLYRAPAGTQLRFLSATPIAGETIRLTFSALHSVAEASTTVPAADHDVVVYLAAAIACEQLSSHYSNAGDSTILADSVDHKSKATEYALRAKRFMGLANELLPVKTQGEIRAAGGETSWGDEAALLTHPHR